MALLVPLINGSCFLSSLDLHFHFPMVQMKTGVNRCLPFSRRRTLEDKFNLCFCPCICIFKPCRNHSVWTTSSGVMGTETNPLICKGSCRRRRRNSERDTSNGGSSVGSPRKSSMGNTVKKVEYKIDGGTLHKTTVRKTTIVTFSA